MVSLGPGSIEPNTSGAKTKTKKDYPEGRMEFYDLKSRSKVKVAEGDVTKKKMVRKTKTGEQTRHALMASYQGRTLYRFVSQKDYDAANVKEVK